MELPPPYILHAATTAPVNQTSASTALLLALFAFGPPHGAQGSSAPQRATQPASGPSATSTSTSQLEIGSIYEAAGPFGDAEAAYRTAALLDAAKPLEEAQRWEDAEVLYRQALQSGSPKQRRFALKKIEELAAIRDSFWQEQVVPTWDASLKALLSTGLLVVYVALFVLLGTLLRSIFRKKHRDRLAIGDFGSMNGGRQPGDSFGETLKFLHERMTAHYRRRIIVGETGKMPVLLDASPSDFLDLITEATDSLVPFGEWLARVTHQPGYAISGWTEPTPQSIKIFARLQHNGKTVHQWLRIYRLRDWFGSEQDLAYEVLLRLKEYTDVHAA